MSNDLHHIDRLLTPVLNRAGTLLGAHQRRMTADEQYRRAVLDLLHSLVVRFAGQHSQVGVAVVNVYGAI